MANQFDYLCECSNCGRTLVDNNPPRDAALLPVPFNTSNTEFLNIGTFEEPDYHWCCPFCRTGEYLTSIKEQLDD